MEKVDKLRQEYEHAKEKANQWQAKERDLEKQIIECENTSIVRMVRDMAVSPEDLKSLLATFQAGKGAQGHEE